MWIYQHTNHRVGNWPNYEPRDCYGWTVGFYAPNGTWRPIRDCDTEQQAAELVHVLNGGTSPAHVADVLTREEALR